MQVRGRKVAAKSDRERNGVGEGREKNQQSKKNRRKRKRGLISVSAKMKGNVWGPQTAGRTKQGCRDLPRRSDMEDGIGALISHCPGFALPAVFLPLRRVQQLCSAARRSRTCFIEQVAARLTAVFVSSSACCIFLALMDGVAFFKGVAPNSRLPTCGCGRPADGFQP